MSFNFEASGTKAEVLGQLHDNPPGTTVGNAIWQALQSALEEDSTKAPAGQTLVYMIQVASQDSGPTTLNVDLTAAFISD